jgi:hyaluronoglucosaminidase
MASPFAVRGLLEGFYGVPFTHPERIDLIRFAGQHDFNAYLYAPKNDRQHRNRWWEPYPRRQLDQFAEAVQVGEQASVAFWYALGPGVSIAYADPADLARVMAKLTTLFDCGVRHFVLALDDLRPELVHPADRDCFATHTQAQAHLCNQVFACLQALDPACRLAMVPTEYHGSAPFPATLAELGQLLEPEIDVFYTGPQVCSPEILVPDALSFGGWAGRPPLIWDNYPVNDLGMRAELHLGPIRNRDAGLARVTRGVFANLMPQAEASKLALLTYAEYLVDPKGYDPDAALERAVIELAGPESAPHLLRLVENSLASCLWDAEPQPLAGLVEAALQALEAGESAASNPAVQALDAYLTDLDEAQYHLINRLENLALRNNLLPWIEQLDNWTQMARNGLRILRGLERGEPDRLALHLFREYRQAALTHPKRIAGRLLEPLGGWVEIQIERRDEPALAHEE